MEKYTHYGKEVIYQQLENQSFKSALRDAGISWIELPLLDSDVVAYTKDGTTKFACIVKGNAPEVYLEDVYLTESIPLDMSWNGLVLDCQAQRAGEQPAELKTKAKAVCEKAEEMALQKAETDSLFSMPQIDPLVFKTALISLGYAPEDILEMDHHDIDEEFLEKMVK